MTAPCRDFEVPLSLRAARALDPAEAERLEAHLAGCAACREEAAIADELVRLARLPPPSEEERVALAHLPARTLGALQRREARRGAGKRLLVGAAVAAAAALAVLAPAILRQAPRPVPPAQGTVAAAWQEPDLDALWDDATLLVETAADQGGTGTEAALAALDAGMGD